MPPEMPIDRETDTETPADGRPEVYVDRVRFHEAFEFAPDAKFITDGYGVVLQANHAAAALTGCPKEFLTGKPLGLLMVDGHRARFYTCLSRLGHGLAAETFETRLARRGGESLAVVVTAHAWDEDGSGASPVARRIRWLIRDVSAQVAAETARGDLMRRLVTAQEEERRRVARELHDGLGQYLVALSLGLQQARTVAGEAAIPLLDRLVALTREVGQEVHRISLELRPTALDDLGLQGALQSYVERWSELAGVSAEFVASRLDTVQPPWEVATAVYRIVQEALTNVLKYAGATHVSVFVEARADHLFAMIEDDGRGFDPDAVLAAPRELGGLGLVGMRERVTLLGGTFQIESTIGEGTTVFLRVPIPSTRGAS
jgi:PAS domain S-box-containing protein